jgi:hypothetical protein
MKTFVTGEVLTAADTNVYLVNCISVVKPANESVTSSITFQDDDDFQVTVAANSTYEVRFMLRTDGSTAGDLKIEFVAPASASFEYALVRLQTGASDGTAVALQACSIGDAPAIGTIGSGTTTPVLINGTLIVAGTAGTFKLQWAQNTSSATATRILSRSHMVLNRIS